MNERLKKSIHHIFARWEFLALIIAALLLGFVFLRRYTANPGIVAWVSLNGEVISEIDLHTAENGVVSLRGGYGVPVDFEIKDGRIRFINVECPDHICERTGFVGLDGQTAVCMPNKTAVVIGTR